MFAYVLILYSFFLVIFIYINKLNELYKSLKIVLLFLFLQAILGVLTLVSELNIYLASFHQITSVLLIFSALNLYYLRAK
jgi:cytochrome c oxidase assembly protein subunit 15